MTGTRPSVALLPLDDRPVNSDDVAMLATASGAALELPPRRLMPPRGDQADRDGLLAWLRTSAQDADALVVSVNQLLYGGYVASRRTTDPVTPLLDRLAELRATRNEQPDRRIHAFMTLMRTKQINDAGAEPAYWEEYGTRFHRLSTEYYRLEHGLDTAVDEALGDVPRPHVDDYMLRRLRLQTVHLALLELVAEGVVDTLSILVEDSSPESLSTSEREWLTAWIRRLGIEERAQCLPGADEAGGSLVMRALLEHRGLRPRIALECADQAALERIALYEDVPIQQTVVQQVRMLGAELVDDAAEADFVLALHPPAQTPRDWCRRPDDEHRADGAAPALAARIRHHLDAGRRVAVADVADANGADPDLVSSLRDAGLLDRIAGYGGWNTAGNTIGSVLAQGCARMLADDCTSRRAQAKLLTRRLLDDWAYQAGARRTVLGDPEVRIHAVERELVASLDVLGPPADSFAVVPGSVRWPWDRSFEIAFELADGVRTAQG